MNSGIWGSYAMIDVLFDSCWYFRVILFSTFLWLGTQNLFVVLFINSGCFIFWILWAEANLFYSLLIGWLCGFKKRFFQPSCCLEYILLTRKQEETFFDLAVHFHKKKINNNKDQCSFSFVYWVSEMRCVLGGPKCIPFILYCWGYSILRYLKLWTSKLGETS